MPSARASGNSEGGDPMGGVTPPPRGEGPPPLLRSTPEMIPLPPGGRGPPVVTEAATTIYRFVPHMEIFLDLAFTPLG
jgi:hypothetical protein